MSRGAVGLLEAEQGLPLLPTAERLADVLLVSGGRLVYGIESP